MTCVAHAGLTGLQLYDNCLQLSKPVKIFFISFYFLKANLESNVSVLRQKNGELATTLDKLERDSENMNIDEAVVTTTPLYNQ